jgi:flagellar hook-basal body complex protein FliE
MALNGIAGIESMLEQMRAVVRTAQAQPGVTEADLVPAAGGFAAELARSVKRVSDVQNASTAQAKAYDLGDPSISLNDVMIDMQKASLGFQMTVQVRNKLVSAYKEISQMAM